jgi:hypothetical protein
MSTILPDATHLEIPPRYPVRPTAPLDAGSVPKDRPEDREVSLELESHGGYLRTVTGTVAYLDEEAQTSMVRTSEGTLVRVPMRDVTKRAGKGV